MTHAANMEELYLPFQPIRGSGNCRKASGSGFAGELWGGGLGGDIFSVPCIPLM